MSKKSYLCTIYIYHKYLNEATTYSLELDNLNKKKASIISKDK